jgi:hypothetical protein
MYVMAARENLKAVFLQAWPLGSRHVVIVAGSSPGMFSEMDEIHRIHRA